jgi:hypothetical protein
VKASDRKEYIVVAVIVIVAVLIFSYISWNHPDIVTEAPNQASVLTSNDMTLSTS